MSYCESCQHDGEPTSPFTHTTPLGRTVTQYLCGDCWRFADHWENLPASQREREIEALNGEAA